MLKAIALDIPSLAFHADIELVKGLNVITGESGTGKSLILEAIAHVFGRRPSRFSKLDRYTISAILEIPVSVIEHLRDRGYEWEGQEISIHITKKEKTTYRINGVLFTEKEVYRLLGDLFSIVSVDERKNLSKDSFRLDLIDRLIDKVHLLKLRTSYDRYLEAEENLKLLETDLSLMIKRFNQLKEWENDLVEISDYIDKYDDLLVLSSKLKQSLELINAARMIKFVVKESSDSIWDKLLYIENLIEKLDIQFEFETVYDFFEDLVERVDKVIEEFEEPEMTPEEVEHILWKIQRLMRKYNVDVNGLRQLLREIGYMKDNIERRKKEVIAAKEGLEQARLAYESASRYVTRLRVNAVDRLQKYLDKNLKKLLGGNIRIILKRKEGIYPYGNDVVHVMFEVGDKKIPVHEVASTGELSRILLMIYSFVPLSNKLMIFDEVDSGTSGQVAQNVAWFLRKLAKHVQVIVATHSQFIAGAADAHFGVIDTGVHRTVRLLEKEDRLLEMAKLIDGGSKRARHLALDIINSYRRGDMDGEG